MQYSIWILDMETDMLVDVRVMTLHYIAFGVHFVTKLSKSHWSAITITLELQCKYEVVT